MSSLEQPVEPDDEELKHVHLRRLEIRTLRFRDEVVDEIGGGRTRASSIEIGILTHLLAKSM
ncbi:hypothetical protein [Stieleria varia]|nr:hypothetical protein [Stieleria varia]